MGWLVPALATLAVAATAAAVVLAIGRNDGGRSIVAPPLTANSTAAATRSDAATDTRTAPGSTTPRSTAPRTTAPRTTASPATTTTRPATTTVRPATTMPPPATTTVATSTAATPTTAQRGLVTWPAGATGFTVVVASLPRAVGLARAQARAREAARRGLPQTGVLVSDGFASLHPGYLVIFSGVYATLAAARRGAAAAQGVYPGAYPRRIAR